MATRALANGAPASSPRNVVALIVARLGQGSGPPPRKNPDPHPAASLASLGGPVPSDRESERTLHPRRDPRATRAPGARGPIRAGLSTRRSASVHRRTNSGPPVDSVDIAHYGSGFIVGPAGIDASR